MQSSYTKQSWIKQRKRYDYEKDCGKGEKWRMFSRADGTRRPGVFTFYVDEGIMDEYVLHLLREKHVSMPIKRTAKKILRRE